jgi:uncharacterized membrane protein
MLGICPQEGGMTNSQEKGKSWMMLAGLAAGAAALYFLDRERGPERRARFSRKAGWLVADLTDTAAKCISDGEHRVRGVVRQVWYGLHRSRPDDRVLEERIRSRMGRVVGHPHRIHVASCDGAVTLWGTATDYEIRKLIHTVEAMPGVVEVLNHIEPREDQAPAAEPNVLQQARQETLLNWSPAARMIVGAAGSATAAYGWKRKDSLGVSLAVLGAGLAAASTMKRNVHSILAFSDDSPGFELEETIRINAPISDLYDFWANPENYPKVFTYITAIERLGENLYRWTLTGPAGLPIHWEGKITRLVPNTLVEWKSLPGSTVGNFGIARFDPNYDASTRVHVRMFYRPPAGILGRVLAELLGSDPKKVLQQDLKRLKRRFETEENLMKELKEGGDTASLLKTART